MSATWLVRGSAIVLLGALSVRAAPGVVQALDHRQVLLLHPELTVAVLLVVSVVGLDRVLKRKDLRFSPSSWLVLLAASSVAFTLGSAPGLIGRSSVEDATFVVLLALASAVATLRLGGVGTASVALWSVFYLAMAGAGFQIGLKPLVATLLVRA